MLSLSEYEICECSHLFFRINVVYSFSELSAVPYFSPVQVADNCDIVCYPSVFSQFLSDKNTTLLIGYLFISA